MELYFHLDINIAITIDETFNFPFDNDGKMLPLSKMTKKQKWEVVNT